MDNRKGDRYYAEKIIDDLKIIIEHTKGISKEDLDSRSILCDSVLFRIIQISESTEKLTEEFKMNHPDIPWRAIKGMRNRIVHEYGDVDMGVVFSTVTKDIPNLYHQLKNEI